MLVDCYVCKHCLDTQLCSGCYKKLQNDKLGPPVCNKDHTMLYLPPFDQGKWQGMSPNIVIVNGQLIPRSQWLNKIRDEYGMQQEQIDMIKLQRVRELKAVSGITRQILRLQMRDKKKRAEYFAAPTLRRAQTPII
jgi:sulfur carrier protein ThiS